MQDYEVLITETPEDEEVARALSEAKQGLERQRGGASAGKNHERMNLIVISNMERFRAYTTSKGITLTASSISIFSIYGYSSNRDHQYHSVYLIDSDICGLLLQQARGQANAADSGAVVQEIPFSKLPQGSFPRKSKKPNSVL